MTTTVSNAPLSNYDVAGDLLSGAANQWFVARPFAVAVEEGATTSYYAWALPGAATSSASWRVMKKTVSGAVSTYTWADGNTNFDNIWDDRASLTYA